MAFLGLFSLLFTGSTEHHLKVNGFHSPLRVHVLAQCRSSLNLQKKHGSLERVGKMQVF